MAAHEAKQTRTGKKPRGREPLAPAAGPLPADQVNLTDEESRIMPVPGGGFEQCDNAQAVVVAGSLLVVATDVVQAPNDKPQLEPMLDKIAALPGELGKIETLLADNGYFSEGNVNGCAAQGIEPVIAMGREAHHPISARIAHIEPEWPDKAACGTARPDVVLRCFAASPQSVGATQRITPIADVDGRAATRAKDWAAQDWVAHLSHRLAPQGGKSRSSLSEVSISTAAIRWASSQLRASFGSRACSSANPPRLFSRLKANSTCQRMR
jgi:hypothetical protein